MNELEMYPGTHPLRALRNGLHGLRIHWKGAVAYFIVVLLLSGAGAYRWVTHVNPVDKNTAIELFRAERDGNASAPVAGGASDRRGAGRRDEVRGRRETRTRDGSAVVMASHSERRQTAQQRTTASSHPNEKWELPEEGVYSWATDGYEEVPGARREFPKESQRIITVNGDGRWTTHHYFSQEHEIWTVFNWGNDGAEIAQQRNKITFGPITNDSTIDFAPPMLVGPKHLEVGYEWGGTWEGDTHGDYSSKIVEHTTMDIGGESVEVWGMSYVINLHGKQEGQVNAQVWLAPDYSLTVQEHYVQDVESSGTKYHAEWTQKLKSLHPEQ
ncbi:MAG: hypothetical protein QOG04_1479 [Actinomycetota bacterium]|jgi:hypothetical protein|nr:hypothetical protein [Actinomycetota bacterium]